ncbi:MAG: O-antigen ligase family protein [Verrucomicrobiota bacterium]|nr:O-antigen ligase family protein [Limisphaera sp.]MDW8381098.1 O-antigen ligase family protein [Verrucomicrobiota bacterium]
MKSARFWATWAKGLEPTQPSAVLNHSSPARARMRRLVPALWGWLCALGLLKFGNPVIMESLIGWPSELFEWVLSPWPILVAYLCLGAVALFTLGTERPLPLPGPRWLALVPAFWLGWQGLSAITTVDGALTRVTMFHFAACTACFYLGALYLGRHATLRPTWIWMVAALIWIELYGLDQRFRGLPATREFLLQHERTHWREFPPEERARWEEAGMLSRTAEGWTVHPKLLEKASSQRISSTLFYPNTLAGALLLCSPVALWSLATTSRFTPAARLFLVLLVGTGAVACLYWSGSKSGWLLTLVVVVLAFCVQPIARVFKWAMVCVLMIAGLALFGMRHHTFFQRGAPSVAARWDYWQAAWQTAKEHPWLGTGPGTFQRPYAQRKRPESEMARLTHNDYLQQASDSGWPGAALYTAWIAGVLLFTGRSVLKWPSHEHFYVWLGCLGWALQSLTEFNLYIPGLAWTFFVWAGWLLTQVGQIPSTMPPGQGYFRTNK